MILIAILICVAMSAIWYAVGFFTAKYKYDQEPKVIYQEPNNVITLVDKVRVSTFDPIFRMYGDEYLEMKYIVPLKKRLASEVFKYVELRRTDDHLTNEIVFEARVKVLGTKGE